MASNHERTRKGTRSICRKQIPTSQGTVVADPLRSRLLQRQFSQACSCHAWLSRQAGFQAAHAPVAAPVRRSRRLSLPCHTEACTAPLERSWVAAPQRQAPKQDAAHRTDILRPSSQLRPGRRMPALQRRKCSGVNAAVQARHAMKHQCMRQLIGGTNTSYHTMHMCSSQEV